jgi:UrcA family protein
MTKYALLALACAAGLSSAAFAEDNDIAVSGADGITRTAEVNIADLDLTKANGKVALHARMKKAVNAVCAEDAACNYTTERQAARLASNAIASANGQLAMATPTHLTVGAR